MMRVLHVIDTSEVGGGQTALSHLLQGFDSTAVKTELACRDGGPLIEQARAVGAAAHPIAFDKRYLPDKARALATVVRSRRIDLMHSHGLLATYYCALARRVFGARVPLVYHQHGFHHHNHGRFTRWARIAAERKLARGADRVIAVSRSDYAQLIEEGYVDPSRLRLVHYGLPSRRIPEAASTAACRAIGDTRGKPVVGLVARFHPQKGVDTFLRAAVLVRQQQPDTIFAIVGVGQLESELRALAGSLGVDDQIRWIDNRVPGVAAMPHFTVGVLASRWEGLPLVLLEYMAAARPIVATTVAGCLDAVDENEAELVSPDDPRAMAEAILRLVTDPELAAKRAQAARARFERAFTVDAMVRNVRRVYEEVTP